MAGKAVLLNKLHFSKVEALKKVESTTEIVSEAPESIKLFFILSPLTASQFWPDHAAIAAMTKFTYCAHAMN
ncbi:MAG: hypothetical protein ACXWIN_03260 [Burkholderiaceae bacterium]